MKLLINTENLSLTNLQKPLQKYILSPKKSHSTKYKQIISSFVFSFLALNAWTQTAHAEGSRTLYPNGSTGSRANIEWRTSSFGGGIVKRRTLLKVFAKQGEYILMGSSAMRINFASGDILIFRPGD